MRKVTGDTLDWCRICGKWVHRKDLVRQRRPELNLVGQNLFTYSNYNATLWSCTATDGGKTSQTPRGQYLKIVYDESSSPTHTLTGGTQTWTGSGTFSSGSVDVSAYSTYVVSARVGTRQDEEYPLLTVVVKADSATLATWTIRGGSNRVFGTGSTLSLADPSSVVFSFVVSSSLDPDDDFNWWIDEMQLEGNASKPGQYKLTTGSAVTVTSDTMVWEVTTVCPVCRTKHNRLVDTSGETVLPPEVIRTNIEAP